MRRLSVSLGAINRPRFSVIFIKFPLPICLSCHLVFSLSLHYNEQTILWRILFSTSAGFPGYPLFPAVSATYFQTFLSSFKGCSM